MEIQAVIDRFQQRKEEKEARLLDFLQGGATKYIVIQRPPADLWGVCNSIEMIYRNNMAYLEQVLELDWTDELPYLEPWIGTGVYANAFGCEYYWREDNAPDIHYRYHKIEEVQGIDYPDYRKSPVMNMVLDCIDVMKERTLGKLPICLTDTQSPFDTATLILDAVEFFTACYTHEEIAHGFMDLITRMIIEFSQVQANQIGHELLAKPGHIMPSSVSFRGISISDDNLAVSSPLINERIALPYNQKIADAFDGVAVHSCGRWAHTMLKLRGFKNIIMVDCALQTDPDPTPHAPEEVRQAMKGSTMITKVRVGSDAVLFIPVLERVFDPSLRLVVHLDFSAERARENYQVVTDMLARLYDGSYPPGFSAAPG